MNLKTLSEFFEETVESVTGFSLEAIDEKKGQIAQLTSHVEQRSYTDSRGTEAVVITTTFPSGKKEVKYSINGKRVSNLPDDIIQSMHLDFEEDRSMGEPLKALPHPLVNGTDFPRLDVYLVPGEDLRIDADVPGIDPERITISFAKEYLGIHIDGAPTNPDPGVYLSKVLDDSSGEYSKEIYVDTSKFDIKNLEYMTKNGRLYIRVPRSDVADNRIVFKPRNTSKPKSTRRKLGEVKEFLKGDEVVPETLNLKNLDFSVKNPDQV